ncbi:MAG TPA: penicillin-binding protein 1C [Mesorhizobium sp.]|jgi:penicillin-binding protein 1C|nr:penicillin-binding protein 1C [Mesorhizobium sp.]
MPSPSWHRWLTVAAAGLVGLVLLAPVSFEALDKSFPPPLPADLPLSAEVSDRDGAVLRAFATPDGRWRLATDLDEVDPDFIRMLLAYEDKRFYAHEGVDALALLRAAGQFAGAGRIVSGGSTLSMQLARLLEPRQGRSVTAKARQIFRAAQLERRLSKEDILRAYLTLAPYGGNLEGVRAASLAWFGKEPKKLSVSEAALLVALPQLPERRRPDRFPDTARAARDRVLDRMVEAGLLGQAERMRAAAEPAPAVRLALPAFAPHLTETALRTDPDRKLTLRRSLQAALETVARDAAEKLGQKLSVALLLADARTGEVLAHVGAADFFDLSRGGAIDMTRAVRSPGSTLKPFIYGLAFEEALAAPETLIDDSPADFSGYRPQNFDMGYQGEVTVRSALQLSLNVPAIRLLDAVGPARLAARFRQAGVEPILPKDEAPGLAIGLGGVGVSLYDLVQLYTGLANGGEAKRLRNGAEAARPEPLANGAVLDERAAWMVGDILLGVAAPEGAARRAIAYKTGTSYGYRDAWSVGYDGRHVLGVWVGRPDGGPVPGLSGYQSAAPILFEAFAKSGLAPKPLPRAPAGAFRQKREELPIALQRFGRDADGLVAVSATEPAPEIVFPPEGARVEAGAGGPLVLKLQGGRAPFRWLANGESLGGPQRRRTATWAPDGQGFATLTVIDAAGRAASVKVFIE